MTRTIPAILIAMLALTGCKKDPSYNLLSPLSACPKCGSWESTVELTDAGATRTMAMIHDRAIIGDIESKVTKLIEDGKTTKASQLVEELKAPRSAVERPTAKDQKLTPEAVYEQCSEAVLVVSGVFKCDKCSRWHAAPAGGFIITESGIAVTNYHVLKDATRETYVARTRDGKVLPIVKVLAASETHDLAVVQLEVPEGVKLTPLPLATDAKTGSTIHVISHPDRHFYSMSTGIVSRNYVRERKPGETVPTLAITADYARGSSGCPVLNDRGQVVGIVASTDSVYYKEENGKQENLQMVFKQCVPVASLLKMIEKE